MKKRAKLAAQDSEPATEKDEQPEMKESEVVETEETIQGLRSAKEEEEAEDEVRGFAKLKNRSKIFLC